MAYEQREGSGALFKNTYKEKETQPDYKGDIMLNGRVQSIAAWVKQGKNGKFFSISVSEKMEKKTDNAQSTPYTANIPRDDENDLPF